jgi:hypothetical protein
MLYVPAALVASSSYIHVAAYEESSSLYNTSAKVETLVGNDGRYLQSGALLYPLYQIASVDEAAELRRIVKTSAQKQEQQHQLEIKRMRYVKMSDTIGRSRA